MTSRKKLIRGFTLVEMIVTLSIIILFVSTAASFLVRDNASDLSDFLPTLQAYVRDTKELAQNGDQSIHLVFSKKKIWRTTTKNPEFPKNNTKTQIGVDVPSVVVIYIKRDSQWQKITDKNSADTMWLFSRSGCCESIEIKFIYGKTDYQYKYDVLTAFVIEEDGE